MTHQKRSELTLTPEWNEVPGYVSAGQHCEGVIWSIGPEDAYSNVDRYD